ncbi:MAG TPA: hypothetical protein VH080_10360 [Gemmatimonadaceae bacterium]|jgi:hypothetical protein|nr:hypothetical protein [Gemmatimonadaceae bacterium]
MSSRIQFGVYLLPVILLVLVVGPPIWLDVAAPEADAVVTRKYEGYRLSRDPDGGWRQVRYIWASFRTPAGVAHNSEMMLGTSEYDNLSVGTHLRVRYLPIYPYTVRPIARTTMIQAREVLTPETTRGRWLALLLIFAPLTFLAGRIARILAVPVALVWLGATWVYVLAPKPLPVPGPSHASARVSWTQVVFRGPTNRRYDRLPTPYRVVGLTFVPPKARDSITVVDAVDSMSLNPKPADGTLVPIGYEPGAPRTARLLVGTRTFINANRSSLVLLGIAPIVLALLVGMHRRKGRRAASATGYPSHPSPLRSS